MINFNLALKDLDGEMWLPVVGYKQHYKVSNMGRVKSVYAKNKRGQRIIKPYLNKRGYLSVSLCKENIAVTQSIHRIVATSFIANPKGKLEVNHKDAVKTNNTVGNLEWCTRMENLQHSWDMGLQSWEGIKNVKSKLSEKQVLLIYHSKKMAVELARKYKVSVASISAIRTGSTWCKLTGGPRIRLPYLTKEAIKDIILKKMPQKELSEKYGLSESRISTMQRKIQNKYKHYGIIPQ